MRLLYWNPHCGAAGQAAVPRRGHAVVVGGSLAGMLAAWALADNFEAVTLLERDHFPESPAPVTGCRGAGTRTICWSGAAKAWSGCSPA